MKNKNVLSLLINRVGMIGLLLSCMLMLITLISFAGMTPAYAGGGGGGSTGGGYGMDGPTAAGTASFTGNFSADPGMAAADAAAANANASMMGSGNSYGVQSTYSSTGGWGYSAGLNASNHGGNGNGNGNGNGGYNQTYTATIQGYKQPSNISTVANQTISVTGGPASAAEPYFFRSVTAGQTYTVTASVPAGYSVGYTLCMNNTGCHGGTPTPGNSATFTIPAGAGQYADLWWHYVAPPTITISSSTVTTGSTVTVTWSPGTHTGCSITPPVGMVLPIAITNTAQYTVTCADGTTVTKTISVEPTITISPSLVRKASPVTVTWDPHGNTGCVLSPQLTDNAKKTQIIYPTNQSIVSITCAGGLSATKTINVLPTLFES